MVWSQFVYEANNGFDPDVSDDDENNDETIHLSIEDWEVQYSDELWHMWNTTRTLMEDAGITHTGQFCDFVEFCYLEHDPYHEQVSSDHEEQLHYIWTCIRRIIVRNGLHEEMLRGATFYHFVDFMKNYIHVY
jgi:hypothetical protein